MIKALLLTVAIISQTYLDASSIPPISLLNFDAVQQGNNINLDWTTASEANNDFFTVERSIDGTNFVVVDTGPGAGNSNTITTYSLIDVGPFVQGIVYYYRLKQTDFDGSSSTSSIVAVQFLTGLFERASRDQLLEVDIAPNPVKYNTTLSIESADNSEYDVRVIDIIGNEVFLGSTRGHKLLISCERLKPGIYFYHVQTQKGRIIKTAAFLKIKPI